MKIDVITMHNVKNYGSVLQTYATQRILEKLNCEVEVIDYYRKDQVEANLVDNRINSSKIFSKNVFTKFIGRMLLTDSIKKQCSKFNKFLQKNINLTALKYYSNEELKQNLPEADIYCTGSDQVWNSEWNKGIEKAFYLDFVPENKTRISYASSFGKTQLDENEKEITKELLSKYKYLSVREESAKKIINGLGIEQVEHVLDPTLMLNMKEWEKLKVNIKEKEKYILVYQLNTNNPKFDKYVKDLSKKKKMPAIRVSNVGYQRLKYGKFINCPSIEEFLSYFINAEYIVTDSFHATAFAINFNKKFVCIFPDKFSTRLQSILDLINLQERKVVDFDELNLIDKNIDYRKVNKIIENERNKSFDFLKKAVNYDKI